MLVQRGPSRPRPPRTFFTIRRMVAGGALLAAWTMIVTLFITQAEPRQNWWHWAMFKGHIPSINDEPMRVWAARMPMLWLSAQRNKVDVPDVTLDIAFEHMQGLWRQRNKAIALGQLEQGEDDYVPATIRLDDRSVRVRLRLKGDVVEDYLQGGRWGFRIHVKGDDHIFGMRRFSLHHPRARSYHGQVVFNAMARHEGILTPRYFFVDVTLNGDFLGRYALEEHFSKELLESQGRRESVIVKFDETLLWEARRIRGDIGGEIYENFAHAKMVPFRAKSIASPTLQNDLNIAIGLARAFAEDSLPASEVFDPVLMGRMIAIGESWAAAHGNQWRNLRFYYNPVTARLEPIAYDSAVNDEWDTPTRMYNSRYRFLNKLLADPKIKSEYLATLARIATVMSDSASHVYLFEVQEHTLRTLRSHYPFVTPLPFDSVAHRAKKMLRFSTGKEDPTGVDAAHLLHAYLVAGAPGPHLELASRDTNQVIVERMFWVHEGRNAIEPFLFASGSQPEYPLRVPGTRRGKAPIMSSFAYKPLPDTAGWTLRLNAGQEDRQRYDVVAESYLPRATANPIPTASLTDVLDRIHFARWDDERQAVVLRAGQWQVNEPLILPDNVKLIVDPGTTIQFGTDAFLLVRGPMSLVGTPESPIRFEALEGQTWQGIVAMPSPSASTWSYVEIDHTSGIDHSGWSLTGGVTFYHHPVTMTHVTFGDNAAEDAVNFVHSTFTLRDITVTDAVSDGIDADFSDGTIATSTFRRIGWGGGGDAVDISGARVTVDSSSFSDIADKALSAGEGSTMEIRAVEIDGAGAGAVAKDRSLVTVTQSNLTAIRHAGLMAYVKKPEYGPAQLHATEITHEGSARLTWVQDGSSIIIDGVAVPTEAVNVDSLYQTIMSKGNK